MQEQEVNLVEIMDKAKLRAFQKGVIATCFALIMVDGFDTQSIAFVAPALRHAWDISPNTFGLLFSAGLLGSMLGAMVLGPVGDRLGRKPLILASTLLFGIMSLLSAWASSVEMLAIYRFTGGLGLGGLLPNAIALVSEYSPRRVRSTTIVATFIGFPLGAVIGGMSSAHIIPAYGWEMVFIIGGVLPLILLVIAWFQLPESIKFLALNKKQPEQVASILARIDPSQSAVAVERLRLPHNTPVKQPVKKLFMDGRAMWTLFLWLLTFSALLLTYFLVHWIPLVLVDAGIAQQNAIKGVALLNLGGIIGSIIISRISDKSGPYLAMSVAMGIAIVFIAAIGISTPAGAAVVLAIIFLAGFTFVGAQLNISAIAAINYPVEIRSAGSGWSIAAGRVGSIVGPLVGGILVSVNLDIDKIFFVAAVPAAVALFAIIMMSRKASDFVTEEQ